MAHSLSLAAMPMPWMACTAWPVKVREAGTLHGSSPSPLRGLGWKPNFPFLPAEGLRRLFSGATMASSRGALVTVGQVGLLHRAGHQ